MKPVRARNREVWVSVVLRDGSAASAYEVSSWGRVRRAVAAVNSPAGRILKSFKKRDGYLAVNIRRYGAGWLTTIHEIVCSSFHGPQPEGKPIIRHLDGVKTNNHACNLAWGTARQNSQDAIAHDHIPKGVRHGRPRAKVTIAQTATIKGMMALGARNIEIVKYYQISPQAVCNIRKGRTGDFVVPIDDAASRSALRALRRELGRQRIKQAASRSHSE